MTPAPVIVRERLAELRRAEVEFEEAWQLALRRVADPEWMVALEQTREAWAGAYDRHEATRAERALSLVGADEDREPLRDEAIPGVCQHCWQPIPAERMAAKGRQAIYCNDKCRRNASYARINAGNGDDRAQAISDSRRKWLRGADAGGGSCVLGSAQSDAGWPPVGVAQTQRVDALGADAGRVGWD